MGLKQFAIATLLVAAMLPVSMVVTWMIFPFWRYIDLNTPLEAFGHSGPAEWCFWLDYILLASIALFFYIRHVRRQDKVL